MKNSSLAFLLFAYLGAAQAESHAPAMFTNCPQSRTLKAPLDGNGVYFSADCSVAYVLPPLTGQILFSQPTQTLNTQVCGAVSGVMDTVSAQSRIVLNLIHQIEKEEQRVSSSGLRDPWLEGRGASPIPDLNPQLEKLEKLREQVSLSVLKVLKFNETLAEYEGPKVRLTISLDHEDLVRAYQKLNPKIVMRPMPVAKSALTFVGQVKSNIGRAPAALFMDLSGVRIPASQFTGFKPGADQAGGSHDQEVIQFSSAVSGQVVLSLVGACPFFDQDAQHFPDQLNGPQLSAFVAPSVDYFYNVEVNRYYRARYNLAELLKRIQKQSTKGGFFTTSTLHSLVIENNSSGWFEFTSLSQDPRHDWDEQLAQNIKASLIGRLLQRLGARPVASGDIPGLLPPGKNGASVASQALKTCPHIYCQAGAYILDGLSAVFGGSEAVSEYINSQNHWELEEVRESKMVPQIGQVRFDKDE